MQGHIGSTEIQREQSGGENNIFLFSFQSLLLAEADFSSGFSTRTPLAVGSSAGCTVLAAEFEDEDEGDAVDDVARLAAEDPFICHAGSEGVLGIEGIEDDDESELEEAREDEGG